MDLGLSHRVAVVLGASSGLGFASAASLAQEGAHVILGARDGERLQSSVKELRLRGATADALPLDLLDPEGIEPALEAIRRLGPDILVCNSGGPPAGNALESSLEEWRKQFNALVLNQIQLARAAIPAMRARNWGRILIVASSGVIAPIPNLAISNGLRSALVGFAKTLAAEVAKFGITVNAVVPGRIATARIAALDRLAAERQGVSLDDIQKKSVETIPCGRYGKIEEFGDVVAFLASARASYVTGHTMRVDGGLIRSV